MKKCVLMFIFLVATLLIAVFTQESNSENIDQSKIVKSSDVVVRSK